MAEQARAVRTRRTIVNAAARVFEERGYRAATISEILQLAGVTKGALYFHFESKDELAQGVLAEQDQSIAVPARACKAQELVDSSLLHAYRLQHDPLVRAGVRLTMDQNAKGLDRRGPFERWTSFTADLLDQARSQGKLLPHVDTYESAKIFVGSFAGVQSLADATGDFENLHLQAMAMMRHLLPSILHPSAMASLDLSPHRGAALYEEARRASPTRAN